MLNKDEKRQALNALATLHGLRKQLDQLDELSPHIMRACRSCRSCEHYEGLVCNKADQVVPDEVIDDGCDEWAWNKVPF